MEQDTQSLYFAVEVTNKAEKAYLIEWLESQGIDSSKLEGLFNFPMLVYTVDGTWMTEYEKVETTVSFREFINILSVELPKVFFKIQGRDARSIGKLLEDFEVDYELPFKVLRALPISTAIIEDCIKVTMHSTSTVEDLNLTKECLQELTEFGFGDFIVKDGTT
jgi:hypothetical protein